MQCHLRNSEESFMWNDLPKIQSLGGEVASSTWIRTDVVFIVRVIFVKENPASQSFVRTWKQSSSCFCLFQGKSLSGSALNSRLMTQKLTHFTQTSSECTAAPILLEWQFSSFHCYWKTRVKGDPFASTIVTGIAFWKDGDSSTGCNISPALNESLKMIFIECLTSITMRSLKERKEENKRETDSQAKVPDPGSD